MKRYLAEIVSSASSDNSVALGFATGSFIAVLPTPGISFLLNMAVMLLFKKLNKVAVLLSMVVWNIFTVIPIYWLSAMLGEKIYGNTPRVYFDVSFLDVAVTFTLRFIVGNLLISVPLAIVSYFVVKFLLQLIRINRIKKKGHKKLRKRSFFLAWRNERIIWRCKRKLRNVS